MDTLQEIMRESAFVICGLIVPQVIGILAYRLLRRRKKSLVALSVLISPALFYIIAYQYWAMSARAIRNQGHYVCGAFGAAAGISTFFGTAIHLLLAIMGLLVLTIITRITSAKVARQQAV